MELYTLGIDLARQSFIWLDLTCAEKSWCGRVFARTAVALHREPEGQTDRHGSLRRSAFSRPGAARTRARGATDAGAVCEAVREDEQERLHRCRSDRRGGWRPTMRFVPIKTDDQLDMQSLHRVRERWVMRRTAVVNQIRGLLLERGITCAKGGAHVNCDCLDPGRCRRQAVRRTCACCWRS